MAKEQPRLIWGGFREGMARVGGPGKAADGGFPHFGLKEGQTVAPGCHSYGINSLALPARDVTIAVQRELAEPVAEPILLKSFPALLIQAF